MVLSLLGDAEGLGASRRLPGAGAWMRAVVHGEVRVLAADVPLLREEIAKFLGGHEPAPRQAGHRTPERASRPDVATLDSPRKQGNLPWLVRASRTG